MSESPKRTVGRRRAAEKSEQKWKEALEEEKTFEALPEVFLGTYINSVVTCSKKGVPEAKISITKSIKNCESKNFETMNPLNVQCSTNYTVLEDIVLRDIIKTVACGTCLTKKLEVSFVKNLSGITEQISVHCTKCKTITCKKKISTFTSKLPSSNDVERNDENFLNIKPKEENFNDENSSNVELLVCDVDVMKEDQCKGDQEQVCDMDVMKEDPCNGDQEQENVEQNKESDIRRRIISLKTKECDLTKPIRPCFFCSKMQARLSRHVKTTHSTHPYVQNMLRQPKDVQAKMMRQLRSEGIFAENQRRIKAGRYDLLRIRNQGTGELSACVYCKGYYKKKLLWRHKVTCIARFNKNNTEEELLVNQDTENSDLENESLDPSVNCVSESENIPNPADFIENEKLNVEEAPVQDPAVDPPEISKIKDILYGIEHGIFSQGEENLNGLFIKQEETDYTDLPDCQLGEKGQLNPVNNLQNHTAVNEDELIFDSIPSLLNNSNISYHTNNYSVMKKKKRRGSSPENNSFTDENYYYMWQDLSSPNLQGEDFLPCNTLYKPNKKRKPRSEFQYQFWKKEEEDNIINYFMDMIIAMKVPGKEACREFLNKNPSIQADWTRVKYKVYNQIQKRRKKLLKNS